MTIPLGRKCELLELLRGLPRSLAPFDIDAPSDLADEDGTIIIET